jgi:hypothetical protein
MGVAARAERRKWRQRAEPPGKTMGGLRVFLYLAFVDECGLS